MPLEIKEYVGTGAIKKKELAPKEKTTSAKKRKRMKEKAVKLSFETSPRK